MTAQFISELRALSAEGGWIFWALIGLGFGIAFALLSLWQLLQLGAAPALSGDRWRGLLLSDAPPAGDLAALRAAAPTAGHLDELKRELFAAPERRFPFAFVMIGAAPLLGLLGTVSGMLATFRGMAGAAVSAPVDVISAGVSEALVTTQTGLVIGVPSLIVCAILKSRFERLRMAFARLEAAALRSGDHASAAH